MDRGPALTVGLRPQAPTQTPPAAGWPAASGAVLADQAIFTSIRSPVGIGYRIIASSGGLTADEKKEITQNSPSNNSLLSSAPAARALSGYPLTSGRYAVACSCYAGIEPTARGGERVYTHVAVVGPDAFAAFECHPLRVEAAVRAAAPQPLTNAPARLERLALSPPSGWRPSMDGHDDDIQRLVVLLALLLAQQRTVVVGSPAREGLLARLLSGLPRALRQSLSFSVGMKCSVSRTFQLVLAGPPSGELERSVAGHDIRIFDWSAPPERALSAFDAWLRFVRRRWQAGRFEELDRLCAGLVEEASADQLALVASLCEEAESARCADAGELMELNRKHAGERPTSPLHADLLRQFHEAVQQRQVQLETLAATHEPEQ